MSQHKGHWLGGHRRTDRPMGDSRQTLHTRRSLRLVVAVSLLGSVLALSTTTRSAADTSGPAEPSGLRGPNVASMQRLLATTVAPQSSPATSTDGGVTTQGSAGDFDATGDARVWDGTGLTSTKSLTQDGDGLSSSVGAGPGGLVATTTLAVFTNPTTSPEWRIGTSELAWVLDINNDHIQDFSIWLWNNGQTLRAALFDATSHILCDGIPSFDPIAKSYTVSVRCLSTSIKQLNYRGWSEFDRPPPSVTVPVVNPDTAIDLRKIINPVLHETPVAQADAPEIHTYDFVPDPWLGPFSNGAYDFKLAAGRTVAIQMAGAAGVPSTGVAAVVLNVTTTGTEGNGYLSVYPCASLATPLPNVSSLNFSNAQTVPNMVIPAVDQRSGKVCFYVSAAAHLIVDVEGWFPTSATGFQPIAPTRILDTRGPLDTSPKVGPAPVTVQVNGAGGVPVGGSGFVALNVTVTQPDQAGFLTVYACGTPPNSSNLNFTAGQTVANAVIAQVSSTGTICLKSSTATHLIVDVTGYIRPGEVGLTASVPIIRAVDTRDGTGGFALRKMFDNEVITLTFSSVFVSAGSSISMNITVTAPDGSGYITAFPCGSQPNASNLNYSQGQTVPNAVIVKMNASKQVCIYASRSTHLIVDIAGYFALNGAGFQPLSSPTRLVDTRLTEY